MRYSNRYHPVGNRRRTPGVEALESRYLLSNVPPVITVDATAEFVENDPPLLIAPSATASDSDSPTLGGGSLTLTNSSAQPLDSLTIRHQGTGTGQIGVSGNEVSFGGTVIGTFGGGVSTTPLVVSLDDDATVVAAGALLRNIQFGNPSDRTAGSRQITFALDDGDGGTSNPVTTTVNITSVNDVPVLANFGADFTYVENAIPELFPVPSPSLIQILMAVC